MGFPGGTVVKHPSANAGDGTQTLGRKDPLEEEMGTRSGILTCRISWTEEPGGSESTGSPRVGHDCAAEHGTEHAVGRMVMNAKHKNNV